MIIGSSFEVRTMRLGETWRKSALCPNFDIKTGIDRCRIGLRCKHESCRYGCYLSNAVGLTSKRYIELELWSNYCT